MILQVIKLIGEGHTVSWFINSNTLTTWDGNIAQIWTIDGAEVQRYRFHKLYMISRNPKVDVIVLGGTMIKKKPKGYIINAGGEILDEVKPFVEWSLDGERLAGYTKNSDKDKILKIWRFSNFHLDEIAELKLKKSIKRVAWMISTEHILVQYSNENKVHVIDLEKGKSSETLTVKGELTQFAPSPTDNIVAVGGSDGEVKLWELVADKKGRFKRKETFKINYKKPIERIKWCSPSHLLINAGGEIHLLEIVSGETLQYGAGKVADITQDRNYLAIGEGSFVKIYGALSQEVRKTIRVNGIVNDLEFSPNGEYLAIASTDYQIRILERLNDF